MSVQRAIEMIEMHLDHYEKLMPRLEKESEELKHKLEVVNNKIAIYTEKVNDLRLILSEVSNEGE